MHQNMKQLLVDTETTTILDNSKTCQKILLSTSFAWYSCPCLVPIANKFYSNSIQQANGGGVVVWSEDLKVSFEHSKIVVVGIGIYNNCFILLCISSVLSSICTL